MGAGLPASDHATITVPATLYVVKTGTALLGMDLFRALRLSIDNNIVFSLGGPVTEIREIKAGSVTGEKLGLA